MIQLQADRVLVSFQRTAQRNGRAHPLGGSKISEGSIKSHCIIDYGQIPAQGLLIPRKIVLNRRTMYNLLATIKRSSRTQTEACAPYI